MYEKIEKFQQIEYLITFQWISSHFGIKENEKTDLLAQNKAEKSGKFTEQ